MSIDRLLVKNFQTHEKLSIDFDPNVTVIVGRTDAGKSSVIRALRWALLNQPRGSSFVKQGQTNVGVKVIIDGTTITRSKDGASNYYSKDDQEFTAFGASVPETVVDFLGIDELNFQQQHDAPFWLSLSPGELSRKLNEIVDLTVIDKATAEVKARLLAQKKIVDSNLIKLKKEKADLDDLAWVDGAASSLDAIDSKESMLKELKISIENCRKHIDKIRGTQQECFEKEQILKTLKKLGKMLDGILSTQKSTISFKQLISQARETRTKAEQKPLDLTRIEELQEKETLLRKKSTVLFDLITSARECERTAQNVIEIPEFSELIERATSVQRAVNRLRGILEVLKEVSVPPPLEIETAEISFNKSVLTQQTAAQLKKAIDLIKTTRTRTQQFEEELSQLNNDIVEKSEGVCPVCGGTLKDGR